MVFRRRVKPRTMVLSSLLAGGSFAAFAIFGWGIQVSAVVKAAGLIVLVFLAISIPALLLLLTMKLAALAVKKIREK